MIIQDMSFVSWSMIYISAEFDGEASPKHSHKVLNVYYLLDYD